MPVAVETPIAQETAGPCATTMAKEKAAELVKQATAFAARATETWERQIPEVQRAMRRSLRAYEDLKAEALHEVKSHPVRSVGLTLAAGVAIGWVIAAVRDSARVRRIARTVCAETRACDADLD